MKVPQTFTITIEQAAFLAQMRAGQRSSYVRTAIDHYRKGPIGVALELGSLRQAHDLMIAYLESQGEYTEYLKWIPGYLKSRVVEFESEE